MAGRKKIEEPKIKKQAGDYLERVKKCVVRRKSNGSPKEFQWELEELEKNQKLDIIGLSKSGKVYVVECKPGEITRPVSGAGQLMRYRVVIERNFEKFRENLKKWAKRDRKRENIKESEIRISKIQLSKLRYYLAVPRHSYSKEWDDILERSFRYLGFKKEDEYDDISIFKYEEKK